MKKQSKKNSQRNSAALLIFISLGILTAIVLGGLLLVKSPTLQNAIRPDYSVFLTIKCPECSTNILEVQECKDLLEHRKNEPELVAWTQQIDFDTNAVSRVEKKVSYNKVISKEPTTEIICLYYNEKKM